MSADKGREEGAVSQEASSETSARPPLRVLIVDDSADGNKNIGRLLQIFGYDVSLAETGRQALEIAESYYPDA